MIVQSTDYLYQHNLQVGIIVYVWSEGKWRQKEQFKLFKLLFSLILPLNLVLYKPYEKNSILTTIYLEQQTVVQVILYDPYYP